MIEVFTICYNEEVLAPYFVRHYSSFCDKITIYDNQSTDRTVEIVKQNPKVKIIPYDTENQIRNSIYRKIKNNCWKNSKADWVIVADFDEFVYMVPGDTRINDYTIIQPRWWDMISDHLPTTDGQIYEEINHGCILGMSKSVMFKPSAIKEIGYEAGAHKCKPFGNVRILSTPFISILHYKMLSLKYYLARTELFKSRLSEEDRKKGWGRHYAFSKESIIKYYEDSWRDKKPILL